MVPCDLQCSGIRTAQSSCKELALNVSGKPITLKLFGRHCSLDHRVSLVYVAAFGKTIGHLPERSSRSDRQCSKSDSGLAWSPSYFLSCVIPVAIALSIAAVMVKDRMAATVWAILLYCSSGSVGVMSADTTGPTASPGSMSSAILAVCAAGGADWSRCEL